MKDDFDFFLFTIFNDTTLDKIESIVKDIYYEEYKSGKLSFTKEHISISDYYNPSLSGKKNEIFSFWVEPNFENYVFFVSNSADGKYTLCNCLNSKLSCEYLLCGLSSDDSEYPMNEIRYKRSDSSERCVLSYKDPKWTFYEEGIPANFENLENYKRKLIRERLNSSIIKEYLLNIGVDFSKLGLNIQDSFTVKLLEKNNQ